jgi:hypothetical protein
MATRNPEGHSPRYWRRHLQAVENAVHVNQPSKAESSTSPKLGLGDTWTILGVLLGVFLVIFVPPLWLKVPIFVVVCGGFVWLVHRSHWTSEWSWPLKFGSAFLTTIAASALAVPQFVAQWRVEQQPRNGNITSTPTWKPTAIGPDASAQDIINALGEEYAHEHNTAPDEKWLNDELQRRGYKLRGHNVKVTSAHQFTLEIEYLPTSLKERDKIIHGFLVEYAKAHPEYRNGLLNTTLDPPSDWINETLRQNGYFFSAIVASNKLGPPYIDNRGTLTNIGINGATLLNETGASANNVDIDLQPWNELSDNETINNAKIETAISQKRT